MPVHRRLMIDHSLLNALRVIEQVVFITTKFIGEVVLLQKQAMMELKIAIAHYLVQGFVQK